MQNIPEIEELIKIIAKLPGLGPRSAKRIVLKMINNREGLIRPMAKNLAEVYKNISRCKNCGSLKSNVEGCFNCESVQEIQVINELAAAKGKTAQIALRINPNVNANTHKYITTGLSENKFGINMWELDDVLEVLKKSDHIELIGLHFHIGSQITDLTSFKNLTSKINTIQQWFYSRQIIVKVINAGGGLGIDYHSPDGQIPDFAEYFRIFNEFLELRPEQEVHFELGRSLVGQCGSLISKVLYIKNGLKKNFAILDAGMTELIRPMLYSAHHELENISSSSSEIIKYDVVGPICESTDCFAKDLELPQTVRGDLFRIKSAGAYGEVMVSDYNLKTLYPAQYS